MLLRGQTGGKRLCCAGAFSACSFTFAAQSLGADRRGFIHAKTRLDLTHTRYAAHRNSNTCNMSAVLRAAGPPCPPCCGGSSVCVSVGMNGTDAADEMIRVKNRRNNY